MGFAEEVKDIVDVYMVGKTLTDGNTTYTKKYPVECRYTNKDEAQYFFIRRGHSGNYLEINAYSEDQTINIELYHIITQLTKDKLFSKFKIYNVLQKNEIHAYSFTDNTGRQITKDKTYDRQLYEFTLKNPESLREFLSIVDHYI